MNVLTNTRLTLACIFLAVSPAAAQFQTWVPKESGGDPVKTLCIAFDDTIVWIGTDKGGAFRYQGKNETAFNKQNGGLVSNEVRDIAIDAKYVWIGTDKGLSRWDGQKTTVFLKDPKGLPSDEITALHVDADGNLWAGTPDGLARNVNDRWTQFTKESTAKALPSDRITSIHSSWNGNIYVATEDGIGVFYKEKWKLFGKELSNFLSQDIKDVYVDDGGPVWVATDKGVGMFINSSWKFFLKGKEVVSVTADAAGNGWAVVKDEGIAKLEAGVETMVTEKDGLASKECFAVHANTYGDVWIGTAKALHKTSDVASAAKWASAIFRKAEMARVQKKWADAKKFYDMFLTRPYFSSAQEAPNAWFQMAQIHAREGRIDKSKELLKSFMQQFPKHGLVKDALIQLGDIAAAEKRLSEAQQYYQKYLDDYPEDGRQAEILWKMGSQLENDGDSFGASRVFQKLNNKFPQNVHFDEIRYKLASLEDQQGRKDAAAQLYTDILATAKDFEVLSQLGDRYDEKHRRDIMLDMKGTVEWKTFEVGSGINHILLDGNNLWLSTQNNGVVKWDITGNAYTTYNDGLTGQNVRQVYIDADGDVWSVINGVSRNALCNMQYSKKKTRWTPMGAPFNNKAVNGIVYRQSTRAIIAATDQGLIILGGGSKTYSSKNGLPSDLVKFAQEDSKGILWMIVGKQLVELYKEPKMIVTGDGVAFNDVRGFYVDANDTKWLATDRGVVTFDGTWKQYTTDDGLISNDVQCVIGARSGKILVGTRQGLSFFNKTFWMNYTEEDGLPSNDVRAVVFTEDESIWIGTQKGVHFRKSSGEGDKKLMVQNVLAQENQLWEKKQYAKARELYQSVSIFSDLSEWIEFKNALTLEKEGNVAAAWSGYQAILKKNPQTRWIQDVHLYRIARKFEAQDKPVQAMDILKPLAEKYKTDRPRSYRIEAALVRLAGKLPKDKADVSLAAYKMIGELFPQSEFLSQAAANLNTIAEQHEAKKDLVSAGLVYNDILRNFPSEESKLNVRLTLARVYETQGKWTDADKLYNDILKTAAAIDPAKLAAEVRLAYVQRRMK